MKKKINIAELLKDCPSGIELNCTMYDNLYFDRVNIIGNIECYVKSKDGYLTRVAFCENGCYTTISNAKCVIFPKGKTTWEGFVPPKPKFKVGDKIVDIYKKHLHCDSASGKISQIIDDKYIFDDGSYIHIQCQDNWELVPNKFDITTLVPFESRVLVRYYYNRMWVPTYWGKYLEDKSDCPYLTTKGYYKHCIPYEGNEHLLGTTNDCDEYYKTWK